MGIHEEITRIFPDLPPCNAQQLPALTLAYIGDTVYDLYVRTYLVQSGGGGAHALHLAAAKHVCAAGQAAAFRRMEPQLTEPERAVFRRGRNAHSGTVPKNASIADYRTATGLETLLGFLYLTGNDARMGALMALAMGNHGETIEFREANDHVDTTKGENI